MSRILTIQSHVVSGYVGNKCATFPLQLLGIDVDPLNTVQVSNHSGYPTIKGLRMEASHFESIFEALELNEKDHYEFIISGYLGNPSAVPSIAKGIQNLCQKKPGLRYLLDPVLGDNGKLYLPKEMIQLYHDLLLPLAYVITPNQFEAELLANQKITSFEDAFKVAVEQLRAPIVIITSLEAFEGEAETSQRMALFVYERSSHQAWCIRYPRWDALFTGTGDLFSALLAACFVAGETDIPKLCSSAIWVMQKVLQATLTHAQGPATTTSSSSTSTSVASALHRKELRLIQCKRDIERLFRITDEEKREAGIEVILDPLKLAH